MLNKIVEIKIFRWLKNIFILKNIYIYIFLLIIALIIFHPWIKFIHTLYTDEETFEVILISVLFALSYLIYNLYKVEVAKREKDLASLKSQRRTLEQRLDDAFKYIGAVNVQIQEIRSIFAELKIYPENKKEFKYIFDFLANKILSIVDVDWVILRIADPESLKTLRETSVCRGNAVLLKYHFTNEDLIRQPGNLKEYSVISAEQKSLTIDVFSIFPRKQITKDQEVFVKAIMNQLEMLYLIFSSNYYKNDIVNSKIANNNLK